MLAVIMICASGAWLGAEESEQPDLQKIEIKDGMYYHGGEPLTRQDEFMEIIRSVNDDQANRHLDSAGGYMTVGIICTVGGGLALGGAVGIGLAGIGEGDSTGAFVVGGIGLGVIITGVIIGLQAQGEFFAAIDRYNAVVDERRKVTVSLGPVSRGLGLRISF
jgi:hypothetical protein